MSCLRPNLETCDTSLTGDGEQFCQKAPDPGVYVVDDRPDIIDGQSGRIPQLPIEVALSWIVRAGVTTAHGDNDVGGFGVLFAERLGELLGGIKTAFVQNGDHRGVERVSRFGSGRPDIYPSGSVMVE